MKPKNVLRVMDISFQYVFASLVFMFMLLKLLRQLRTKNPTPPGPWKLPLVGSIHHLGSSLPHHRFKELADEYGPLMHLQLGELSVVVVSSPETAKQVMKTHDINFADRPFLYAAEVICSGAPTLSFAPYGDYWRRLRKICSQELLSPTRVQSFGPFGAGRRVCPGMAFGLPNIELPLIKLLYHFDWKLPDGMTDKDLDMNESFGVTVKRKASLNLIPTAYYPSPVDLQI